MIRDLIVDDFVVVNKQKRIDRHTVDADLEVQVGAGSVAGLTDVAELIARL